MVVTPERRDGRGRRGLGLHGVVAGDEVEALLVLGHDDLVDAVVAAGFDGAEELHLVDLVVAVAVAEAIEAAGDLLLVIVDAGIEGAERPHHAVDGANAHRHLLDVVGLEGLAGGGGREAVEVAILVAGVDAAFVVGAQRDPGTERFSRDGIEQLDLEAFGGLDAVDGRGFVLADGLAGIGLGGLLGRSLGFGLRLGRGLGGVGGELEEGLGGGLHDRLSLLGRGLLRLGLGRGFLDLLRVARDRVLLQGEQAAFGEFLEHDVLDLDDHGRTFVHLEGEQAFERAVLLVVVDEVDGDLAVDLLREVVALGDDGVLMPLGVVDLHGFVLGGEPLAALFIDDDALAVLDEDAAGALFVDHAVVGGRWMDVALVAADDPLADFGELLAAILDAGVAGGALDLGPQLEVLHDAAAPDDELIIREMVGPLGLAGEGTFLDGPELRVPVPAGEGLAVEDRLEAVLGRKRGEGGQQERQQRREGVSHGSIFVYAPWTPVNRTCSNGGKWS